MNGESQSDINESVDPSDLPKIVGFELRYIPSIYLCDTMLVWCWVCLSVCHKSVFCQRKQLDGLN